MSDWKAYRELNAEATPEQHEKVQSMWHQMFAEGEINTYGSEEVGNMVVSAGRPEREHRVPVVTPGMVKVSWEDDFGVQWQAWLAADGEVVEAYSFIEGYDEEGIDGKWIRQTGRAARFNSRKAGA